MATLSYEMLAERVGFEPTIPVKVYTLSKRAPSATRPSLRSSKSSLGCARDFASGLGRPLSGSTQDPSTARLAALRSGFRLTAPASLTPPKRLNFSHSAISPDEVTSHSHYSQCRHGALPGINSEFSGELKKDKKISGGSNSRLISVLPVYKPESF